MNERLRALIVIAAFAAVMLLGYFSFLKPYFSDQRAVDKVLHANSTWTITMQQYLMSGPLSSQTYRVNNDNGKPSMFYSATNRDGTVTKQFDVPLSGPEATYLFEALRAEGLWELPDKPVRPHPRDEYVFYVAQTLGNEGGHRAFGFSDPVYWATTKGTEFYLDLKHPNKPVSSMTRSLREPRYLNLVELMETFGPPSVQQAQGKIRAELAATNGASPAVTK